MKATNQNLSANQGEIQGRTKTQSHVLRNVKNQASFRSEIKNGRRKLGTLEGTEGYFMSDDFQITTPEEFKA